MTKDINIHFIQPLIETDLCNIYIAIKLLSSTIFKTLLLSYYIIIKCLL